MRKILLFIHLIQLSFLFSFSQESNDSISHQFRYDTTNIILNGESLAPFFSKLKNIPKNKERVSILHVGDSHMMMGYFIGEMRKCLSNAFPLSGYGMLFPYSMLNYKPFYIHVNKIQGVWEGANYLKPEQKLPLGITGFALQTKSTYAQFHISPRRVPEEIASGNQVILYYAGDPAADIKIQGINFKDTNTIIQSTGIVADTLMTPISKWKKAIYNFDNVINEIKISINQKYDSIPFIIYGLQLINSDKMGITYHNCGVGGATFLSLTNNSSLSLSQIQDLNPDLIIFSYGSNEAYTSAFNAEKYYLSISDYISSVRNTLPTTSILLTAPPDTRSKNRYPRNNDSIIYVLKNISTKNIVAFWDLRSQMGGDGSLYKWLKGGLASKDQLHFTKEGYEMQAKLLSEALFIEYNKSLPPTEHVSLPTFQKNFK
jgi:lysophospholipase L1-like esterase